MGWILSGVGLVDNIGAHLQNLIDELRISNGSGTKGPIRTSWISIDRRIRDAADFNGSLQQFKKIGLATGDLGKPGNSASLIPRLRIGPIACVSLSGVGHPRQTKVFLDVGWGSLFQESITYAVGIFEIGKIGLRRGGNGTIGANPEHSVQGKALLDQRFACHRLGSVIAGETRTGNANLPEGRV